MVFNRTTIEPETSENLFSCLCFPSPKALGIILISLDNMIIHHFMPKVYPSFWVSGGQTGGPYKKTNPFGNR